jgi:subtilase family serine protease
LVAIAPAVSTPSAPVYRIVNGSGPLPPQIAFTVTLKPRANLTSYLSSVEQPDGSAYRQFLTDSEVGQLFGPSPGTLSLVSSYFESYGLSVIPSGDRLSLEVHGTTADAATALHTQFSTYLEERTQNLALSDGAGVPGSPIQGAHTSSGNVSYTPYYANSAPVELPERLSSVIDGIAGLQSARAVPALMHVSNLVPRAAQGRQAEQRIVRPGTSSPCSPVSYGTCLTPSQAFNDSYGNFTWIYNLSYGYPFDWQFLMPGTLPALVGAYALWNGSTAIGGRSDTGQNITVAVVETGCMTPSTLQNFSLQLWGNRNQVTSRFTQIALPGMSNSGNWTTQATLSQCVANGVASGWIAETALDIEYLAAMAPSVHIDLVGVPSPQFGDFDYAYQFISTYLSTGQPCPSSFGTTGATIVGVANDTGACSVSIDSNSYGAGETYVAFTGSPLYLTAENQLLTVMSIQGITNFFASGDSGGNANSYGLIQASVPAVASGSVPVGGGQLTAAAPDGSAFQNSSMYVPMCLLGGASTCAYNRTMNVSSPAGIYSYTYWDYVEGSLSGIEGGGHGPSGTLSTPWWENANDTYSLGVKVIPVISNAASFNMTIWMPGPATSNGYEAWAVGYGGTSFATPITAGEWALVENQAVASGHGPRFGDINALLFSLHGARQAGVPYAQPSAFVPMEPVYNSQPYTANVDQFSWEMYNESSLQPPTVTLPPLSFTVYSLAQGGWDSLGGLGLLDAAVTANDVVGPDQGSPSVLREPFYVEEVSGNNVTTFTELNGGSRYAFEVVNATSGKPVPDVRVWAYSGGLNQGTYGGGTTIGIVSSTGEFSYTPGYGGNGSIANYTEYAYFAVTTQAPGGAWAYHLYAVVPPPPAGTLTMEVSTPSGQVSSGTAEVDSWAAFDLSDIYMLGAPAQVLLDGHPVAGAVVSETTVNWNGSLSTAGGLSPSYWAPGTLVSDFVSDTSGQVYYYLDSEAMLGPGSTPTQVYQLQARYEGLTSATITVFLEPQFGFFWPDISVSQAGTAIRGNLTVTDMKYLSWLNVSYGGIYGHYLNLSCSNSPQFCNVYNSSANGSESGLSGGTFPVDLSLSGAHVDQIVVNITAGGNDTIPYTYILNGVSVAGVAVIHALWNYSVTLAGAPVPTVLLMSAPAGPVVSGIVDLSYTAGWSTGTQSLSGAVGLLTERWSGGSVALVSGRQMVNNGTLTYGWNTSGTPAGYVTISFAVSTPGGVTSSVADTYYVAKPAITVTPSEPVAGENVTFVAWSPGGSGASYAWSFGDGGRSANMTPVHIYSAAGTYGVNVTVNVTGNLSIRETAVVTVVPARGMSVLESVSVSPGSDTLSEGGRASFTVTGVCSGGGCPAGVVYAWTVNNSLGSLSNSTGTTTNFQAGPRAGQVTLESSGTWDGQTVQSAAVVITISAQPVPVLTGVSVSPSTVTVKANGTVVLSAAAECGGGACPSGATYAWSVGNGLGKINSTGGVSVTFSAGSVPGLDEVHVNGTLNGVRKGGTATVDITATSIGNPPPGGHGTDTGGVPQWVWWLLVVAIAAAVSVTAGVGFTRRSRKRRQKAENHRRSPRTDDQGEETEAPHAGLPPPPIDGNG